MKAEEIEKMEAEAFLINRGDGEGSSYTTDYVEILMSDFAKQQNKELKIKELDAINILNGRGTMGMKITNLKVVFEIFKPQNK